MIFIKQIQEEEDRTFKCKKFIFNENLEEEKQYQCEVPFSGNKIYFETPFVLENGDIYIKTREKRFGKKVLSSKDDKWSNRFYYFNFT